MRMADGINIKVNGRTWPVEASGDTPLLYVLTNELELRGPRFGCGLAQCGSCSVLADGLRYAGRQCRGQGGDHARRPAGLVCAGEGPAAAAGAASAATGVHRGAGAAMRLLLQRHADQGLGAALAESVADAGADPQPHEWTPLSLRHLSAGDEGHSACVHQNGGSDAMNILSDSNF